MTLEGEKAKSEGLRLVEGEGITGPMTGGTGSNLPPVGEGANLSWKVLREGQCVKKIENEGCSHYVIENKYPASGTMSYTQYVYENKRPTDFLQFA